MKSICLKTVNTESIDYLLENLNKLKLDNIYLSLKNFKIYTNIIIHFTGKNEKLFTMEIAKLLTYLVIDLYEENIINNIIKNEYFYFDSIERNQILEITIEDLYNQEETVLSRDKIFDYLFNNFYEYLNYNKSIVIKGFITFRIKNYIDILIYVFVIIICLIPLPYYIDAPGGLINVFDKISEISELSKRVAYLLFVAIFLITEHLDLLFSNISKRFRLFPNIFII